MFEKNKIFYVDDVNTKHETIKNFKDDKILFNYFKKSAFILFCCFCFICFINFKEIRDNNYTKSIKKIYFDQYEVYKYNEIKKKLLETKCSQMSSNEREFINGIIRKYKPHKILEVGVNYGGSSIIMLNAIQDIKGSKLFSIDLNDKEYVGECVYKYFPKFVKNWKLFKGNIATEFMDKIGNDIDMAFFDTAHLEPGEILDFLIVLPFLKKEAVVIFHDIAKQIYETIRREWAPYIIFNGIRGLKYLPSGNYILKHNIGAIQLEKNQMNYYHDYFRLLGGQWQYFPKEIHINLCKNYFKKYYDKECLIIFDEATDFNRRLVKKNPLFIFYKYTSDEKTKK